MKFFDDCGWIVVSLAALMMLAQAIRFLFKWLF